MLIPKEFPISHFTFLVWVALHSFSLSISIRVGNWRKWCKKEKKLGQVVATDLYTEVWPAPLTPLTHLAIVFMLFISLIHSLEGYYEFMLTKIDIGRSLQPTILLYTLSASAADVHIRMNAFISETRSAKSTKLVDKMLYDCT